MVFDLLIMFRVFLSLVIPLICSSRPGLAESTPAFFDFEQLDLRRSELASETGLLQAAYLQLIARAEKALPAPLVSVLDKERLAPSGGAHDYFSVRKYAWPNPDTGDGLPYISRDGVTNPDNDRLDRGALRELIPRVEDLSLAGYLSGRAEFSQRAAEQIRVWFLDPATRMNPHFKYAQMIPGSETVDGIGIIDLSRVSPPLFNALALLEKSDAWSAADQKAMRQWMGELAAWLRDSEQGKAEAAMTNNHGLWYDVLLAAAALYAGDTATANGVFEAACQQRVEGQITADGRLPKEEGRTKSYAYTYMALEALVSLDHLARRHGDGLPGCEEGTRMRAALDRLAPYALEETKWPHQQLRPLSDNRVYLVYRQAAVLLEEPRYDAVAAKVLMEAEDLPRLRFYYGLPRKE